MKFVLLHRKDLSFKPLSTVNARRGRMGMASFVTTACPSAASVGARIAAAKATATIGQSGKNSAPAIVPNAIESGNPITSMRTGQTNRRFKAAKSV